MPGWTDSLRSPPVPGGGYLALLLFLVLECPHLEAQDREPQLRILQQALPLVTNVDFQDRDLSTNTISGSVSWDPPADTSELSGYEVFLTDSVGTLAVELHLGSVSVGTHTLAVPANTSLITAAGNRTHIFVFSRSPLGVSPQGVGVEVCDVSSQDTIFLVNAAQATVDWGVSKLEFYPSTDCSGAAFRWVESGSTQHHSGYEASGATDGDSNSAWVSSCSSCAAGAISIGVIGVCQPDTVRCVRVKQCIAGAGACPASSGRMPKLTLIARGEEVHTWKVLKDQPTGNVNDQEEVLVAVGRRRRAGYVKFSDTLSDKHFTHQFHSR